MWALAVSDPALGFNVINFCGTPLIARSVVSLGCWKGEWQVSAVSD